MSRWKDSLERSSSSLFSSDCKLVNRTDGRGGLPTRWWILTRPPDLLPLYLHLFFMRMTEIWAWSRINSISVMPWSVSPVLVLVSTPSRCRLLSLVYLSPVFPVSLYQFVLFVKPTSVFVSQLLLFPVSLFLPSWFWPLPVLTLSPPAWPLCLPLTSSLPIVLYHLDSDLVYELSPVPDLPFDYPFCYNKYWSSTICLLCLYLGLAWCPYNILHVRLIKEKIFIQFEMSNRCSDIQKLFSGVRDSSSNITYKISYDRLQHKYTPQLSNDLSCVFFNSKHFSGQEKLPQVAM
jgi:hypothetical protein